MPEAPLLTIERLSVATRPGWWSRERHEIVAGIDLTLHGGETLAVVGESGSGKTTLIRALFGLVPRRAGTLSLGAERLDLADPRAADSVRRHAALVPQGAAASLSPRMRIAGLLVEPLRIRRRLAGRRPIEEARRLLRLVDLPEAVAERYPHQVSGGQARRIGLARALAAEPRILVTDEPTAGLDVSVQGEIVNLIAALQRRNGFAHLMITHSLALVRHVADRIAVVYLGRIVEAGAVDAVLATPMHPYTAALLAALPAPGVATGARVPLSGEPPDHRARPTGCEFHPRCPRAAARCRAEPPAEREIAGRRLRCHFPLTEESPA